MSTLFLTYVVTQLLTTAFGLAVIDRVQTVIKTRLKEQGYVLKNKNSLYNFNEGLMAFLKGFIPFYYLYKALTLTSSPDAIEKEVEKGIASGKYKQIKQEEAKEELPPVVNIESEIIFEKPEKYTARKNDLSLYDTYITPIEYVAKEETNTENLSLTPFTDENRTVEHVMVKENVTKSDIAKAIGELSLEELDALNNTILTLKQIKKNNIQLSLKDVA